MIIVVNKATGAVKDINQQYDSRYFDHVEAPEGTIRDVVDCPKYVRDGSGKIVLRPVAVDPYKEAISKARTLEELKAALLQ